LRKRGSAWSDHDPKLPLRVTKTSFKIEKKLTKLPRYLGYCFWGNTGIVVKSDQRSEALGGKETSCLVGAGTKNDIASLIYMPEQSNQAVLDK
jgi:hypothetical protein